MGFELRATCMLSGHASNRASAPGVCRRSMCVDWVTWVSDVCKSTLFLTVTQSEKEKCQLRSLNFFLKNLSNRNNLIKVIRKSIAIFSFARFPITIYYQRQILTDSQFVTSKLIKHHSNQIDACLLCQIIISIADNHVACPLWKFPLG